MCLSINFEPILVQKRKSKTPERVWRKSWFKNLRWSKMWKTHQNFEEDKENGKVSQENRI